MRKPNHCEPGAASEALPAIEDVSDFHTHTVVKASTDVDRDFEAMRDLIYALEVRRRNAENISQQDADSWAHQLSGLICRVKNRVAE